MPRRIRRDRRSVHLLQVLPVSARNRYELLGEGQRGPRFGERVVEVIGSAGGWSIRVGRRASPGSRLLGCWPGSVALEFFGNLTATGSAA